MAESKKEIYDILPRGKYPTTILAIENQPFEKIINDVYDSGIQFPMIAKPDIGLRGSAVKKINNIEDLKDYHARANFDFLVQQLIPFHREIGIFYVRFPNESIGRITGIVSKEFVSVKGNGKSTVRELVLQNPRYAMQLSQIEREQPTKMDIVLPLDEQLELIPYGNHARGAKFLDASHLISDKLNKVIDEICREIPDFYFGRLDIMFDSFSDLEQGKNFMLVEVNGASSEPTHIYDPKHSIFFAWKELLRHNNYMFKISLANKKRGANFLSHRDGMAQYRIHLEQSRKIINF